MKSTLGIVGLIAVLLALFALYPLGIMLLWNWLMPSLFGLGTISFWEALGLRLLSSFLFVPVFTVNRRKN